MHQLSTLLPSLWLITIPLLLILIINKLISSKQSKSSQPQNATTTSPKAYPIIGHLLAIYQHRSNVLQWLAAQVISSPSSSFVVRRPGRVSILTGNPANVEHILKTKFAIYQKGTLHHTTYSDLFGDSMFTVNGEQLKFQRQVAIHDFNSKSLRKFVETVVDHQITDRLLPILSHASENEKVLDLQDIFQRFAFDNVCKVAFGHDPKCLSLSLSPVKFSIAFDQAVLYTTMRNKSFLPIVWKIRRFLNVGSERLLKESIREVREFTNSLIRNKKELLIKNSTNSEKTASKNDDDKEDDDDMLSRFIKSIPTDEKLISDIMVSVIIAGRDTTSAALTWFFWLLHKNKSVEQEIICEIRKIRMEKSNSNDGNEFSYEETKEMIYTHAALSESMRLYPPVPFDGKQAVCDDVLPDGTPVKKGWIVAYMPYAMGRMEKIWGSDWAEYRPERWLVRQQDTGECKWKFVARDPFSYPVFQAGPRICLGKEMAFLQMKRVVAAILERFTVLPASSQGTEPVYVTHLTAKMQGGFPVRFQERINSL